MCYSVTKYLVGQVWLIKGKDNKLYFKDGIIEKTRPAVIIKINSNGSLIVLPISTSENAEREYDYTIKFIDGNEYRWILCSQIKTVSENDMIKYKYTITDRLMRDVKLSIGSMFKIIRSDIIKNETETSKKKEEDVNKQIIENDDEEEYYDDGKIRLKKSVLLETINCYYNGTKIDTMKNYGKYFNNSWSKIQEIVTIMTNDHMDEIEDIVNKKEEKKKYIAPPKHISGQRYSDDELEFIKYKIDNGFTQQEIADAIGMTQAQISYIKRKHLRI